jgi:hypothetical protein
MHGVGVYAGPDRPPDASWGDEGERLREAYSERAEGPSSALGREQAGDLLGVPPVPACRGPHAARFKFLGDGLEGR